MGPKFDGLIAEARERAKIAIAFVQVCPKCHQSVDWVVWPTYALTLKRVWQTNSDYDKLLIRY